MVNARVVFGVSLGFMLLSAGISTAATASEKDQYTFFNPTPKALMREMSTDRPDKTESPYTVDAGHYQVELSVLDYSYDRRNPEHSNERVDTFTVMPFNLKAGLLNNVDLQLVIDPYAEEYTRADGQKTTESGFGDIQSRLKINLWGNDGGPTALALMPFVKFPTHTGNLGTDGVESGLIIPLAVALPAEWHMGLMTEFDFNRNAQKDYYTDFINSITFSHQVIGDLSGYVEFFSSFNNEPDTTWVGTVDMGLTYALTGDIQLDAGVNIGVTRAADDFNPFLGCSIRY